MVTNVGFEAKASKREPEPRVVTCVKQEKKRANRGRNLGGEWEASGDQNETADSFIEAVQQAGKDSPALGISVILDQLVKIGPITAKIVRRRIMGMISGFKTECCNFWNLLPDPEVATPPGLLKKQ